MQQARSTTNALRQYARDIGSEPSDFINTLSEALGQSIWLCNEDFDIVWNSSNTNDILLTDNLQDVSEHTISDSLRKSLKSINYSECGIHKGVFKEGGVELGFTVLPVTKENTTMGYIVTVAEGIGAKLTGLLERQRKREKLCRWKT
jgi:hypothetical protein